MSKKSRNSRVVSAFALIASGLVILCFVCVLMWFKLKDITNAQVTTHVAGYSHMMTKIIDNSFADELSFLEDVTAFIDIETGEFDNIFPQEDGVSYGVMKIDGEAASGEKLDFSEYSGFFDSLH